MVGSGPSENRRFSGDPFLRNGPVGIRTRSLPVANRTLYQVELRAR